MKQKLLFTFLFSGLFFGINLQSFSQGWIGNSNISPNVLYPINGSNATTPLKVGIGTNTPTAQLHTTGTVRFGGLFSNNTLSRIIVSDSKGNLRWRDLSTINSTSGWKLTGNSIGATEFIGTTNAADFRVRTNNIQRINVNGKGNVSINSVVTNNFAKLDVYNSIEDQHFFASGSSPSLVLSQVDSLEPFSSTSPFAKIGLATHPHAYASGSLAGDLVLVNYNNNAIIFSTQTRSSITNNTLTDEKMRIDANGNVGVGITAPTARLHTNGTVRFQNLPATTTNGNLLLIDADGNLFKGNTAAAKANPGKSEEVKDLQVQLLELKNELEALKNQIALLSSSRSAATVTNTDLMPYLETNIPNPFTSATVVNYSIPAAFSSGVSYINIADASGKLLKKYNITNTFKGSLNITDLTDLSSEILICSLEVNGKVYDYKKMIRAK